MNQPQQTILEFYVPQTYLEHAEYIWMSDDPTDIYMIQMPLFTEGYLKHRTHSESMECMHRLDKQTQINLALLMAAIHSEI